MARTATEKTAETAAPPVEPRRRDGGRLVYTAERLREIAFSLGGIGTGTISLGGRANLRDFEIANRPAKGQPPLRNFFAVAVDDGSGAPNARILERQLFPPFTGHRGIPLHLVPGLPRFPEATFTGDYPLAKVALSDPGFPLRATLEAFNPMIPGNVADSGLPVAYFLWTLQNTGGRHVRGQLVATLANLVGYPMTPWPGDPEWMGGAPRNAALRERAFQGVQLGSERDGGRHPMAGTMALATTWQDTALLPQWERQDWPMSLRPFWYQVLGELPFDESVRPGMERPAQYQRAQAALAARFSLQPGEQATVPVIVSWHFPNRVLPPAERQGKEDGWVGNQYATRFSDAAAVLRYAVVERDRLEAQTRAFHAHLYGSTLPDAAMDAVGGNLQVLRSQTCFITASGRFYGYEGVNQDVGCCFGTCTHVWMYEQALAHLYPQLERNIREHAFMVETEPDGRMYFRSRLMDLARPQRQVGHPATDGQMAEVIQVLRDYRLSGDRAFLERLWPQAKRALEHAWLPGGWDADRDGVMEGTQHNTTDIEFYGPNPLCTVLYLVALRAGAVMARELGDEESAAGYEEMAERGARRAEEILWNGEYYVQRFDLASDAPPEPFNQMGSGCLTDQLFGQWLAHTTGFGRLLDRDRIRSALGAVYRHNFRRMADVPTNFMRAYAVNDERGLLYANFPQAPGEVLPITSVFRAPEVWTGCEYQAACHMI